METPVYISLTYLALTLVSMVLFYLSTGKNKLIMLIVLLLATIQSVLSLNGFFLRTDTVPPRLLAAVLPPFLLILLAFITKRGRKLIDGIDLHIYTYLHTLRVGVEMVIYWLVLRELMPESMSFEGRNFDILSGLTAPLVAYFGFRRKVLGRKAMLWWNIICLGLVLQVVITGIFSAPSVIQQWAFSQPNVAVFYFPYVLLPGLMVPMVIFGHLVAIRRFLFVRFKPKAD